MSEVENHETQSYQKQIGEWEYCYCKKCDHIKYSSELEATPEGIRCRDCGSYELESPAWVCCPYEIRCSIVKCPRGGRGIKVTPEGERCVYNCTFRTQTT